MFRLLGKKIAGASASARRHALPILWITIVGAAAAHAEPQSRCVAVVGTNDLHGAIEPYTITAQSSHVRMGGLIGLSGYIKNLQDNYGKRLVLLDGGDLFQGTLPSNLSYGKAVIEGYNALGYTAAAVGNHEFDFGAAAGNADRIGILKQRMAQAQFPFLTLNIFERSSGQRVAWPNTQPSILRNVGGIQVGIMGISTVDTPRVTKPENVVDLEFRDPVPLIVREAQVLRQSGAELIVLVGHVGGHCRSLRNADDISSCSTEAKDTELFQILKSLPKGTVDVAVGGHTHQFIAHWVNGTATIESGSRGKYLAWVNACVGPQGGIDARKSTIHAATALCLETWSDNTCRNRQVATAVTPATFLGQAVQPLASITGAMQPYLNAVAEIASRRVGARVPQLISGGPLADMVAESMRRINGADFGLQNRGGIRADLPPGPTTYQDVFQVLPFDNAVMQLHLTGRQVRALVRLFGGRHPSNPGPGIAGLKLMRGAVLTQSGEPLRDDQLYWLNTSDFIVQGGDGSDAVLKDVKPTDVRSTDKSMRDAFIDFLKAVHPDSPP